jgi:hypothetical protein
MRRLWPVLGCCARQKEKRRPINVTVSGMKMLIIPEKIINLVEATSEGSRAKIKLSDECSESFDTETGLRQGGALSPMLFNIVLEAVLINIDKRGNISTKMRQTCAYADDISITAGSRDALVETFNTLRRDTKRFGLIISQGKQNKYSTKNIFSLCSVNKGASFHCCSRWNTKKKTFPVILPRAEVASKK